MADDGAPSSRADVIEPAPAPAALAAEPVAARKPRGRPPGSRNKPKPPVVVTLESEAAMRPVVLELAPGCDVASAVAAFARRRRVGVSVLCGRGAVAAVRLRLATSPSAASTTVTLHGRFEVLSLSGTVLPPSPEEGSAAVALAPPRPFSVSLAGAGGQVIGGTLAGEMTAADGVVLVAATFGSAEVHRLPAAGAGEDGGGGRDEEGRHPHHYSFQQQQAGDVVGLGAYGGDGGGASGGGHVGQHAPLLPEMALWAQQPTSNRGPAQALPQYF